MRLLFYCFAVSCICIVDAGLLGNITMPVEFFDLHVDYQNPGKIFTEFEEFAVKYKKQYKTMEEKQFRFNIYVKNYNTITKLNAAAQERGRDTVFGVNHFADRTDQEFRRMLSHVHPMNSSDIPKINVDVSPRFNRSKRSTVPDSYDLRTVTLKSSGDSIVGPIKNQGECGCCFAFSTTAVSETANAIGSGHFRSLSDQEVCDCGLPTNTQTPGCTGGDLGVAIRYVGRYGLASDHDYVYVDGRSKQLGLCDMNQYRRAMKANVIYFHEIQSQDMESAIKRQLYQYNIPAATFFRVGEQMKWYESGILYQEDCRNTKEAEWHSCPIIGYDTQQQDGQMMDYYLFKNSWSTEWGDNGFFKVKRGINWCDIEERPVTARLNTGGNGGSYYDYNDY